jgi:hypothetical protein
VTTEARQFNFTAALTAVIVVGYVGASAYAFALNITSWQEFSGTVGPIAGTMLGYWFRGVRA